MRIRGAAQATLTKEFAFRNAVGTSLRQQPPQTGRVDRLGQMSGKTRRVRLALVLLLSTAGESDQAQLGPAALLFQRARRSASIQLRHCHIQKRHLWTEQLRNRDCGLSVVGGAYFTALEREQHRQALGGVLIIVRDQYAQLFGYYARQFRRLAVRCLAYRLDEPA